MTRSSTPAPAWLTRLFPLLSALHAVAPSPAAADPVRIPTPGGSVLSADAAQHDFLYREWHFAPARIEGDLIFVSGVVAGARDAAPLDAAGFEAALRRAFGQIRRLLDAAGAGPAPMIDITSFHVFGSPAFAGGKADHVAAFRRVKDEFVPEPYPTWTAIGVADLFPPNGLVEIRVVARRGR